MIQVNTIPELGKAGKDPIEVYVPTDREELAYFLAGDIDPSSIDRGLGYIDSYNNFQDERVRHYRDEHPDYGPFHPFIEPKYQIVVDCVDIPIPESERIRREKGFTPMGKVVYYAKQNIDITSLLIDLAKVLRAERQNIVIINGERVYVEVSNFSC